MKVINIKNGKFARVSKFIKSIDLLDGQRRGEVIARRVFVLIIAALLIYLALYFLVGEKEPLPVEAKEKIMYTYEEATGHEYAPVETKVERKIENTVEDSVSKFVNAYGGRIDSEYLGILRIYCSEETLKSVIAISVSETSMGKNTTRKTNFFGWFKDRNRNYDPDSKEEMAQEICEGVASHYSGVGANTKIANRYTGGDKTAVWMKNYNWALSKMK